MAEQFENFIGGQSKIHPVNITKHLSDEIKVQLINIFKNDKGIAAKNLLILCSAKDDSWQLLFPEKEIIDPVELSHSKTQEEINIIAQVFGELYIAKDLRPMTTSAAFEYAKKWISHLSNTGYNTLSAKIRNNPNGIDLEEAKIFLAPYHSRHNSIGKGYHDIHATEAQKFRKFLGQVAN